MQGLHQMQTKEAERLQNELRRRQEVEKCLRENPDKLPNVYTPEMFLLELKAKKNEFERAFTELENLSHELDCPSNAQFVAAEREKYISQEIKEANLVSDLLKKNLKLSNEKIENTKKNIMAKIYQTEQLLEQPLVTMTDFAEKVDVAQLLIDCSHFTNKFE